MDQNNSPSVWAENSLGVNSAAQQWEPRPHYTHYYPGHHHYPWHHHYPYHHYPHYHFHPHHQYYPYPSGLYPYYPYSPYPY